MRKLTIEENEYHINVNDEINVSFSSMDVHPKTGWDDIYRNLCTPFEFKPPYNAEPDMIDEMLVPIYTSLNEMRNGMREYVRLKRKQARESIDIEERYTSAADMLDVGEISLSDRTKRRKVNNNNNNNNITHNDQFKSTSSISNDTSCTLTVEEEIDAILKSL